MKQTQSLLCIEAINAFGEQHMIEHKLIQHHEKYLEIHGEDKIVLMTMSEHKKLHFRLRQEGKCKILPDTLEKISQNAHNRTEKRILQKRLNIKRYRPYIPKIDFTERLEPYAFLCETIQYNIKTNTASVFSRFLSGGGKHLRVINDE